MGTTRGRSSARVRALDDRAGPVPDSTSVAARQECWVNLFLIWCSLLQTLGHALAAKQTLAAFQALLSNKDWLSAAEALAHAEALAAAAGHPALRCLASFEDEVSSCRAQQQVELVHAVTEAATLPAMAEVTEHAAAVLNVCVRALLVIHSVRSARGRGGVQRVPDIHPSCCVQAFAPGEIACRCRARRARVAVWRTPSSPTT